MYSTVPTVSLVSLRWWVVFCWEFCFGFGELVLDVALSLSLSASISLLQGGFRIATKYMLVRVTDAHLTVKVFIVISKSCGMGLNSVEPVVDSVIEEYKTVMEEPVLSKERL